MRAVQTTCNMGRRVSVKSTGSHKFTVINYGKNANISSHTTFEELPESKSAESCEYNADAKTGSRPPRNDNFRPCESGIWMGRKGSVCEACHNHDTIDPAECNWAPNKCYQCRNSVIEEGVEWEGASPCTSFKSTKEAFTNADDNPERNDLGDKGKCNDDMKEMSSKPKILECPLRTYFKNDKEIEEGMPEEKSSLSRNHNVVLQIEDFSDDNLDENKENPSNERRIELQVPKTAGSRNKRRHKTDSALVCNSSGKHLPPSHTHQTSPASGNTLDTYISAGNSSNCMGSSSNCKVDACSGRNECQPDETDHLVTNEGCERTSVNKGSTQLLQESRNDSSSTDKSSTIVVSDSINSNGKSLKNPRSQVTHWRDVKLAKLGRIYCKRNKLRLVQQNGDCNVVYSKVDKRGVRYLNDLYTTLMEIKWRYIISVYLLSFLLSWNLFALLWWSIHNIYGVAEDGTTCVIGVIDFKTALLFSIETQSTIGYGSRSVTDMCPPAFLLLMIQTVFGAVSQCIATGLIFSKLSRPSRRAETIIFSKNAVICSRDNYTSPVISKDLDYDVDNKDQDSNNSVFLDEGHLNLEFRVGDIRNSQLIGVRISAILVKKNFIQNGRQVELKQERLQISTESEDDFYFLAWPITVIHRIDQKSPFWGTTNHHLALAEFEILIVLEANCESTGGTVQVKTSYLPSEIVWGARLEPLFTRPKYNGRYTVDYSRFHQIIPDPRMISEEEIEIVANLFGTQIPKRSRFRFSFKESALPTLESKVCTMSPPMKFLSKLTSRKKKKKRVSYQYEEAKEVVNKSNVYVKKITDTTIFNLNDIKGESMEDKIDAKLLDKSEVVQNPDLVTHHVDKSDGDSNAIMDSNSKCSNNIQENHKPKVNFGLTTNQTTPCLYQQHAHQHTPHQRLQHSGRQQQHSKLKCNHQANIQQTPVCPHHSLRHHHAYHQPKKFTPKPSYISLQSYDSLPSLAYEDLSEDEKATMINTQSNNPSSNKEL